MATSRVPSTFVALVNSLTTACAPVPVYYGPVATDDPLKKAVGIGFDGNREGSYKSVENWSQEWAGLGALRKNETFDILCYAISWTGDASASGQRIIEVFDVIADIEDSLRTDPTLGLSQPFIAEFASGDLFLDEGQMARVTFSIHIRFGRI